MHWLIASALSREPGFDFLMDQIQKQNVKHTICYKPPMVEYLTEQGKKDPIELDIDGPVFVAGTTSMNKVSEIHGWNPGYIDVPSFHDCLSHWGNHMLNHDSLTGTIKDIEPPADCNFFLRPANDGKLFSGKISHAEKFEQFRNDVLSIKGSSAFPPDTLIQIAPIKPIWAEYRCMMIGGSYVTGSQYKKGREVKYSPLVGNRFIEFAQQMTHLWCPRSAFVMDLADTPDGIKIIELNSISSAGFYNSDMGKFISAINETDHSKF